MLFVFVAHFGIVVYWLLLATKQYDYRVIPAVLMILGPY